MLFPVYCLVLLFRWPTFCRGFSFYHDYFPWEYEDCSISPRLDPYLTLDHMIICTLGIHKTHPFVDNLIKAAPCQTLQMVVLDCVNGSSCRAYRRVCCFSVGCLAFDFCRYCVVIRFFHPRHNAQWPPTSKDFYTRSYPLHYFLILILEKEPVFPFTILSKYPHVSPAYKPPLPNPNNNILLLKSLLPNRKTK